MVDGPSEQLDPESLVARIILELQANPQAQRLLLRVLLTNEFLGMPARLDRIEKDILELKTDVAELKTDVGSLKGSDLEMRVQRKIQPLLSQRLQLRRARIVQSALHQAEAGFQDAIAQAVDDGRISSDEEHRIIATDLILRAQRTRERTPAWVAVEVASRIDAEDVRRSRESAETLAAVFGEEAVPMVVGYRLDRADRDRAAAAGVRCVNLAEQF